jgi:hypothetical protein
MNLLSRSRWSTSFDEARRNVNDDIPKRWLL